MPEYLYTNDQGLPYPSAAEGVLKNLNDYVRNLALAVEPFLVRRYANQAAYDTANPSPEHGTMYALLDVDEVYYVTASGPKRVFPTDPKFSFGSGAPTGTGEAGEVYFDLSED